MGEGGRGGAGSVFCGNLCVLLKARAAEATGTEPPALARFVTVDRTPGRFRKPDEAIPSAAPNLEGREKCVRC